MRVQPVVPHADPEAGGDIVQRRRPGEALPRETEEGRNGPEMENHQDEAREDV
jgi:hypothetical protein